MTGPKDEKLIPAYLREKPQILLPPEPPGKRLDDLTEEDVRVMLGRLAEKLSVDIRDEELVKKLVQHYNRLALKKVRWAQELLVEDIVKKLNRLRKATEGETQP